MDPRGILYVGMYKCHGSARVMVLYGRYHFCIYLGYKGGAPWLQLVATGGHAVSSFAYIQYCSSDWGEIEVGSRYMCPGRCEQGVRLRAKLGWSSPETLAVRHWTCAHALPIAGCTWSQGRESQRAAGIDTETGPALASPRACCFVTWLLHCTHRMRPCFLLVAMPLHCPALPLYLQRSKGPAQGQC